MLLSIVSSDPNAGKDMYVASSPWFAGANLPDLAHQFYAVVKVSVRRGDGLFTIMWIITLIWRHAAERRSVPERVQEFRTISRHL
jgi:hypothetical protein